MGIDFYSEKSKGDLTSDEEIKELDKDENQDIFSFILGIKFSYNHFTDEQFSYYFKYSKDYGAIFGGSLNSIDYMFLDFAFLLYEFQTEHYLNEALSTITGFYFDLNYKHYFKVFSDKFLLPAVGIGIGYKNLGWTYKNPIVDYYEGEKEIIQGDSVGGLQINFITGIRLITLWKFQLELEEKFTYIFYTKETVKKFKNDVFLNEASFKTGLLLHFVF